MGCTVSAESLAIASDAFIVHLKTLRKIIDIACKITVLFPQNSYFADFEGVFVKLSDLRGGPVFPVFYDGLRLMLREGVRFSVDIFFDGSGYQIVVLNTRRQGWALLHSERSKNPRVFRSVDTAVKVC